MSRAVQPEPVASTTAPDADEARTARRATPVADDHRDTVWAGRLRKPYVLLPAVVAVAVVRGLGVGAPAPPAATRWPGSHGAARPHGPASPAVDPERPV